MWNSPQLLIKYESLLLLYSVDNIFAFTSIGQWNLYDLSRTFWSYFEVQCHQDYFTGVLEIYDLHFILLIVTEFNFLSDNFGNISLSWLHEVFTTKVSGENSIILNGHLSTKNPNFTLYIYRECHRFEEEHFLERCSLGLVAEHVEFFFVTLKISLSKKNLRRKVSGVEHFVSITNHCHYGILFSASASYL